MTETKLRQERQSRGDSIFKVGSSCGIRDYHLSAFERRKTVVFPKYRKALAGYYGLPESALFDADGFAREVSE